MPLHCFYYLEVNDLLSNVSAIINSMSIYSRKDGRYEGRIFLGEGKSKSFYGKTKAELKNKAKEYLHKVENGYREPQKILLNDYIEYWLKTYKWNKIEPTSYTRLYRVFDCQIRNSIGNKMIGNVTTADIQNLINERANPTSKDIRPLALSGLKKILHLLKPCMQMAVREGIISSNPCDNVILPVESCISVKTKEQITMSDNEIERFRESALTRYKTTGEYRSRDALVLLIILNLGLRVGEMQALRWRDVDFETEIVKVNRTMQSNIKNFSDTGKSNYSRIKDSTKTYSGKRVLKMNDAVVFYLKELQAYDERNKIVSEYVCSSHSNSIVDDRNLQRSLDKIVDRAKITEHITLHTLRHTFGSTLIRKGVGVEVVSKLMGHANINITYLKYIHVLQEQQAMAMQMVKIC